MSPKLPHLRAATLSLLTLPAAWAQTNPVNDSGIDFCREHASGADTAISASTTCTPLPTHGGQDARYGRDAAAAKGVLPKVGAGAKGFDYTKISHSGATLPASAVLGTGAGDWACTYDNHTGLMWEVKVDDASHLRHKDHTYSWYFSANSHGGPGVASSGACLTAGRCDTEKFAQDVNAVGLCGHNDWRLPTVQELYNLADRGSATGAIDFDYFPYTPAMQFWSASPMARVAGNAWTVRFLDGANGWTSRGGALRVRLVRTGL